MYQQFLLLTLLAFSSLFFFFNDTATTEIYTLSLHDALPIYRPTFPPAGVVVERRDLVEAELLVVIGTDPLRRDRKSTRLNSSHVEISYAVFCLKKKKNKNMTSNIAQATVSHITTPVQLHIDA